MNKTNKMQNILHISVRADYGGGPRHLDVVLHNTSYKVYVACPQDKPYYSTWNNLPKVKDICTIPHRKFTLSAFYRLLRFCKKNQISVIHSHGKGAGIYSRFLKAFLPSVKVIHTYHGVGGFFLSGIKSKLSLLVERKLAILTDLAINVSFSEQSESKNIKLLPRSGSTVIYNGIEALSSKAHSDVPLQIDHEQFIITTLSRFDYPKNMSACFDIALKLSNNKNLTFLWIGDGEDKAYLEKKAHDLGLSNIVFTGFRTDINYLLSKTDLYLSTSRWEGLPIALIEAASLGIPIVASDVVGNNEVVESGENGLLYPLKDTDLACKYILDLYKNQKVYKEMSDAAIKRYHTYFTSEKMIESLENVYKNI